MSRHLQVLPKLRSTTAKLHQAAAGKENADSNVVVTKRSQIHQSENKEVSKSDENCLNPKIDESDHKSCQTPKSDANRIPKTLNCPPAPKKPIRRAGVLSCKRKLMPELEFFEADRHKEVDEFFRSSFERISAATAKRKVAAAAASVAGSSASSSSSSSPAPPPPCNYV
ncbi:unnamed protein product [Rhodiola kirilowii]